MSIFPAVWPSPAHHIRAETPNGPVLYASPAVLQATYRQFRDGFPGLVTYAVKANDTSIVLENLVAAGMEAFDVASPEEMAAVRAAHPLARLHYNNPVRGMDEIAAAVGFDVASYSVDALSELEKLAPGGVRAGTEVAARLKLPVAGATYDFGAKFGASPAECVVLLRRIAEMGFAPSMTFHPGTQCADPAAWAAYIEMCAVVADEAGVTLERLNVGGGFPSHRTGHAPDLARIFDAIASATRAAFHRPPALLCEPGRAMVADAMTLAARVKALRIDGAVFLSDGIYGGLAELPVMGLTDRIDVLDALGQPRRAPATPRTVFGPTCDSLDRLPGDLPLPTDLAEGDYVLFHGMGAYSTATRTHFNGYGHIAVTAVDHLR